MNPPKPHQRPKGRKATQELFPPSLWSLQSLSSLPLRPLPLANFLFRTIKPTAAQKDGIINFARILIRAVMRYHNNAEVWYNSIQMQPQAQK